MASQTLWTWVWVSSGNWCWTGKPGVLQSMGSQRVEHDWMTELNWCSLFMFSRYHICTPASQQEGGFRNQNFLLEGKCPIDFHQWCFAQNCATHPPQTSHRQRIKSSRPAEIHHDPFPGSWSYSLSSLSSLKNLTCWKIQSLKTLGKEKGNGDWLLRKQWTVSLTHSKGRIAKPKGIWHYILNLQYQSPNYLPKIVYQMKVPVTCMKWLNCPHSTTLVF